MNVGDRKSWQVKAGESLVTPFFLLPPRASIHLLSSEKASAPFLMMMALERDGASANETARPVGGEVLPWDFHCNQIVMGVAEGDMYRLKTDSVAQADLTIELWLYEVGPDPLVVAVDQLLQAGGIDEIAKAISGLRLIREKQRGPSKRRSWS